MKLFLGDCLEVMKQIPGGSVDLVLCDPPYGTTACKWDNAIPFEPLWEQLHRVCKPNAAMCMFGSEPFSSRLRMSNLKRFKYDWIWDKKLASNFAAVKHQPLKYHETISVFSERAHFYSPQFRDTVKKPFGKMVKAPTSQHGMNIPHTGKCGVGYPRSILEFARPNNLSGGGLHPTQKPVPLLEYLIRTYTNEGETVLDNCMGSGSTGVASVNMGRKFVGIELDPKYFEIAKQRIQAALVAKGQLPKYV